MKSAIFYIMAIPLSFILVVSDLIRITLVYTLAILGLIPVLCSRFEWWAADPKSEYFYNDPRHTSVYDHCVVEFKNSLKKYL